jgi:hypothetical protein
MTAGPMRANCRGAPDAVAERAGMFFQSGDIVMPSTDLSVGSSSGLTRIGGSGSQSESAQQKAGINGCRRVSANQKSDFVRYLDEVKPLCINGVGLMPSWRADRLDDLSGQDRPANSAGRPRLTPRPPGRARRNWASLSPLRRPRRIAADCLVSSVVAEIIRHVRL